MHLLSEFTLWVRTVYVSAHGVLRRAEQNEERIMTLKNSTYTPLKLSTL